MALPVAARGPFFLRDGIPRQKARGTKGGASVDLLAARGLLSPPHRQTSAPDRPHGFRLSHGRGGGGVGVVHTAEDTEAHRLVALKYLTEERIRDNRAFGIAEGGGSFSRTYSELLATRPNAM
jgi:hypothetical protein